MSAQPYRADLHLHSAIHKLLPRVVEVPRISPPTTFCTLRKETQVLDDSKHDMQIVVQQIGHHTSTNVAKKPHLLWLQVVYRSLSLTNQLKLHVQPVANHSISDSKFLQRTYLALKVPMFERCS